MANDVPPRDRLMSAAHLFYDGGIRAVGINRVLEEAQTPIMTLYRHFGSKEGLVEAYLERRDQRVRERIDTQVAQRATSGREKILAVFEVLGEIFAEPDYRGCAFINASVEMADADHPVSRLALRHKDAVRGRFAEYAADAGVADPEGLAVQLQLLADGACVTADMRRNPSAAAAARAAAAALLDAASA